MYEASEVRVTAQAVDGMYGAADMRQEMRHDMILAQ